MHPRRDSVSDLDHYLSKERYPEFAVLKADLLLASAGAEGAAMWLESACDVAGVWGVRVSQLRAATRLARMGTGADALDVLRGVYETFTEGFDTPDLVAARAVLAGAP
jgi:hypothetical protein